MIQRKEQLHDSGFLGKKRYPSNYVKILTVDQTAAAIKACGVNKIVRIFSPKPLKLVSSISADPDNPVQQGEPAPASSVT